MRKYLAVARVSLGNALQYRGGVLTGFLFYGMFLFVFYHLWRAIYAGGGVDGYTFQQMIWYLCVTELISYGARVRVHTEIAEDVKTGAVAYQLLRPYDYIAYQAANSLGRIVCSFAMFGALAVATGLVAVGPIEGYRWYFLPPALLSIVLGVALNFMLLMCIGLFAFRMEDVKGIYLVYSKFVFMLGTFIPVEFLPVWMQGTVKCLPFSYVAWGPAKLTVAFTPEAFFAIVPVQVFWLAVFTLAARLLYKSGMRGMRVNGG